MSGGGGDGGGQFSSNPWSNAPGASGKVDGPGAGSSGSSGVPVGAADQDTCAKLVFNARLRNVDPDELLKVTEGDVMEVEYQSAPTPSVGVFRPGSRAQLGALAERLTELLPCLQSRRFECEILVVDGGNTRVKVRPA